MHDRIQAKTIDIAIHASCSGAFQKSPLLKSTWAIDWDSHVITLYVETSEWGVNWHTQYECRRTVYKQAEYQDLFTVHVSEVQVWHILHSPCGAIATFPNDVEMCSRRGLINEGRRSLHCWYRAGHAVWDPDSSVFCWHMLCIGQGPWSIMIIWWFIVYIFTCFLRLSLVLSCPTEHSPSPSQLLCFLVLSVSVRWRSWCGPHWTL